MCYSNAAKTRDLGVAEKLLASEGAVSDEVVRAMAEGAKWIRPSKVYVVIGKPIPAPTLDENGRISRERIKRSTDQLHGELQRLFDLAQRKVGA